MQMATFSRRCSHFYFWKISWWNQKEENGNGENYLPIFYYLNLITNFAF